ncbi:hypothetical protein [Natronolimnobius baerhuensis]|uniref:Uncharacterized protein n=1 Tax=Natronolimnobius baerhuensis TaxID=253108 RepID=A0A202EDA9_9EURY|nr:hypothetical protein [Natronolimnobius baerhuensis]OVE86221.1 hypothetical protein B2G88_05405 [Natronolimnobius baerhuensis]
MDETTDLPSSGADTVVERGETYDHDQYGTVEVSAIWKGVNGVDTTREAVETDTYIVRYSADDDGDPVDELTDTLDEFLEAIE